MIRPATLITMVLAAGSGLYLYQVKHQAQLLDEQIARILKDTDRARQRTGELVAEYALLNDPSRLQDLAAAHLRLRPTEPTQFTTLAELAHRLPDVGAAPSAQPEPPADIAPTVVSQAAAPPVPMVAASPLAPPAGKPRVAVALPPPAVAPVAVATRVAKPRPQPAYQPGLFGAPVQQATLPARPPTRPSSFAPVLAAAHAVRPVPFAPAPFPIAPVVGSALGMARAMPAGYAPP